MQETKTAKAIRLMTEGKIQEALAIAKGFRLGLTKQDRAALARAHECFTHPDFYTSLGHDPQEAIQAGITVFMEKVAKTTSPTL